MPKKSSPFELKHKSKICKICKGKVRFVGKIDFNRVSLTPSPFPRAGIPIKIVQCQECGFAWAPVFDTWTSSDFSTYIYNDQISLIETEENARARSENVIRMIQRYFKPDEGIRFLDYGCGPGLLVEHLKRAGFEATGYDPYYPEQSERPLEHYDVVTCFEVMEHCHQPQETVADLLSFLKPGGIVMLGTFLTGAPIDLNWWYCTPRGGHIAFYTVPALSHLFTTHQMQIKSDGQVFHVAYGKGSTHLTKNIFRQA